MSISMPVSVSSTSLGLAITCITSSFIDNFKRVCVPKNILSIIFALIVFKFFGAFPIWTFSGLKVSIPEPFKQFWGRVNSPIFELNKLFFDVPFIKFWPPKNCAVRTSIGLL